MKRFFVLLVIIGLVSPALAQNKSKARAEADRIANERRTEARLLLISLASDARTFRDLKLRARALMRIADVLWDVDPDQARALFRKAWDAAVSADENQGSYNLGEGPLNIRSEVLAVSAKRDRRLAEEFLEKLKTDQDENKNEPAADNPWSLPEAQQQRLNTAESLLRAGDVERALQFADPVLNRVTVSTLSFLSRLREHNPTAADQRYGVLLANTRNNMQADANTISLLSSYIFTPQTYLIFNSQGLADGAQPPTPLPPANVDPQLMLSFFQTAASVLLRPQSRPEQDQTSNGIAAKYAVVKRLMPRFDQYAPKELAEAMRGQLEALNSLVSSGVRQAENEVAQNGSSPELPFPDNEKSSLEEVEAAKTSAERDELYFKLALVAMAKGDLKARDYVDKIDESGLRQRTKAWVDWGLAFGAIKKKKTNVALELARKGELTHIQRVWILADAAKLLVKTDRDRAFSVLDEAALEVLRIDGGDLDRPRGLLAIANALRLIDPLRAWEAAFDAVKAANSVEGFTGEDGAVTLSLVSEKVIWTGREANPDFDVEGILGELTKADYERTVQLARGFQGEAPRANATIAIARSLLNNIRAAAPARSTPKN